MNNEESKLEAQQEQLDIPVVMHSILVKLIKDVYFKGYGDGYSVMYNEEFVGSDKSMLKQIDGIDKVVEDTLKKYCA